MNDVFLSYAREDKELARALERGLAARDLSVFIDTTSLVPGHDLLHSITEALEQANVVVVLLSRHSGRSQWVEQELAHALEQRKKIIAVLIEPGAKENWIWPLVAGRVTVNVQGESDIGRVIQMVVDQLGPSGISKMRTVDPAELTIGKLIWSLKPAQLRAVVAAVIAVIIGTASAGYWFRKYFPSRTKPVPTVAGQTLSACDGRLGLKLDRDLGAGNWFVYPDDNPNQVGVTNFPAKRPIPSSILEVDNDDGEFYPGQVLPRSIGSHAILSCAWRLGDIPSWQRDALQVWHKAQLHSRVTREKIDDIFGNKDWKVNPRFSFSAIGTLSKELRIGFPITSVDFENRKYGVGTDHVFGPGDTLRIWVAGTIP
jgi:hypothetical protein